MISSADFAEQNILKHLAKQEQHRQSERERQRQSKLNVDRTEFAFRSNTSNKFGNRSEINSLRQSQRKERPKSESNRFTSSSSSSSSSSSMNQQRQQVEDAFSGKGKATMSTGNEVWNDPEIGPEEHLYLNNMRQADMTAKVKIATMQSMLDKKLGPELVAKRTGPGSSKVTYIEGWKSLDLANKVFGFNGWASEIIRLSMDFCEQDLNKKWKAGAHCIIRITLRDGTFHEDVGYGAASGMSDQAMILQKVLKEAVTDATKRCLRQFGNLLGNCLYDKNYLAQLSKMKPEPYPSADPNNVMRHNSPAKGPGGSGGEGKAMPPPPPPPSRPQQQGQQQGQQQQQGSSNHNGTSSSSTNNPHQNNMNRSPTTPSHVKVNHSSNTIQSRNEKAQPTRSSTSSSSSIKQNNHPLIDSKSESKSSILKSSNNFFTGNNNSKSNSKSTGTPTSTKPQTAYDLKEDLNDSEMQELMMDDSEYFDEFDDAVDSELIEASFEDEIELEKEEAPLKKGGSGSGPCNHADDSGIAISPKVDNATTSKRSSQGTLAQSDDSQSEISPKLERLEESKSEPQPPPQSKHHQNLQSRTQSTSNTSKGRFASPGERAGSMQSGAMSLSKILTSNVTNPSSPSSGGNSSRNSSIEPNRKDSSASTLNRRSHTTNPSTNSSSLGNGSGSRNGNAGYSAVGSTFSTTTSNSNGNGFSDAANVPREGSVPEGLEQRARSSIGNGSSNSVQGRNSSHAHMPPTTTTTTNSNPSRKRGSDGSEIGKVGNPTDKNVQRSPLDPLTTSIDGSVKRRKEDVKT